MMSDEWTLNEAAKAIGISRSALYGRVRRERKKGEAVPFSKKRGSRQLTASKTEFMEWASARYELPEAKIEAKMSDQKDEKASAAAPAASASVAASPLAPSAKDASKEAVETEPKVNAGAPVIKELPDSYMENSLVVMLHDPDRIVVYWDVHPDTAKQYAGRRWALLVKTNAGEELIEIGHGARNWYIDQPDITKKHEIYFGPLDEMGSLISVARAAWAPLTHPTHTEWGRGVVGENGVELHQAASIPAVNSEALCQASMPHHVGGSGSEGLHRPVSSGAPSSEAKP